MKILFADDDRELVDLLRYAFKRDGYTPVTVFDGEAALRAVESEAPDIVVLDINMPKRTGLSVLQELRSHSQVPVIMLTAMGDEDQIVNAFQAGADDYLVKPFRPRELKARVQALLRRSIASLTKPDTSKPLTVGAITLDPQRRQVTVSGVPVELSKTEFGLLHYLMLNKGITLGVSEILANVWGYDADESEDIVKMTISRLRRKIEPNPAQPCYILTKHGVGYMFQDRP